MSSNITTRGARRQIDFSKENKDQVISNTINKKQQTKRHKSSDDNKLETSDRALRRRKLQKFENSVKESDEVKSKTGSPEKTTPQKNSNEVSVSERTTRQNARQKNVPLKSDNKKEEKVAEPKRKMTVEKNDESNSSKLNQDKSPVSERSIRHSVRQKSLSPVKKTEANDQRLRSSRRNTPVQKNSEERMASYNSLPQSIRNKTSSHLRNNRVEEKMIGHQEKVPNKKNAKDITSGDELNVSQSDKAEMSSEKTNTPKSVSSFTDISEELNLENPIQQTIRKTASPLKSNDKKEEKSKSHTKPSDTKSIEGNISELDQSRDESSAAERPKRQSFRQKSSLPMKKNLKTAVQKSCEENNLSDESYISETALSEESGFIEKHRNQSSKKTPIKNTDKKDREITESPGKRVEQETKNESKSEGDLSETELTVSETPLRQSIRKKSLSLCKTTPQKNYKENGLSDESYISETAASEESGFIEKHGNQSSKKTPIKNTDKKDKEIRKSADQKRNKDSISEGDRSVHGVTVSKKPLRQSIRQKSFSPLKNNLQENKEENGASDISEADLSEESSAYEKLSVRKTITPLKSQDEKQEQITKNHGKWTDQKSSSEGDLSGDELSASKTPTRHSVRQKSLSPLKNSLRKITTQKSYKENDASDISEADLSEKSNISEKPSRQSVRKTAVPLKSQDEKQEQISKNLGKRTDQKRSKESSSEEDLSGDESSISERSARHRIRQKSRIPLKNSLRKKTAQKSYKEKSESDISEADLSEESNISEKSVGQRVRKTVIPLCSDEEHKITKNHGKRTAQKGNNENSSEEDLSGDDSSVSETPTRHRIRQKSLSPLKTSLRKKTAQKSYKENDASDISEADLSEESNISEKPSRRSIRKTAVPLKSQDEKQEQTKKNLGKRSKESSSEEDLSGDESSISETPTRLRIRQKSHSPLKNSLQKPNIKKYSEVASDSDEFIEESDVSQESVQNHIKQRSVCSLTNRNKKVILDFNDRKMQQRKRSDRTSEGKTSVNSSKIGLYPRRQIPVSCSPSNERKGKNTRNLRERTVKKDYKDNDGEDSDFVDDRSSFSSSFSSHHSETDESKDSSKLSSISPADLCDDSEESTQESKQKTSVNSLTNDEKEGRLTRNRQGKILQKNSRIRDVANSKLCNNSKVNSYNVMDKQSAGMYECVVVLERINVSDKLIQDCLQSNKLVLNKSIRKTSASSSKDERKGRVTAKRNLKGTVKRLDVEDESSEDLSYEAKREKNIKEKLEFLKTLNIEIEKDSVSKPQKKRRVRQAIQDKLPSRPKSLRIQTLYPEGLPNYGLKYTKEEIERGYFDDSDSSIESNSSYLKSLEKKKILIGKHQQDEQEVTETVCLKDILESNLCRDQNLDELIEKLNYVSGSFNSERYKSRNQLSSIEMKEICTEMQLCQPSSTRIVPNRMSALAVHPNSLSLIVFAGTRDGLLGIWDVETDDEDTDNVWVFELCSQEITCLGISPLESDYLYVSAHDAMKRLNIENSKIDLKYDFSSEKTDKPIASFDFISPSVLCLGQRRGCITILDCRDDNKTTRSSHTLFSKKETARCVSVHPVKQDYIAISHSDAVTLWDIRNLKDETPVHTLPSKSTTVFSATFSPVTGQHLLVSSENNVGVYEVSVSDSETCTTSEISDIDFTEEIYNKSSASWVPGIEEAFVIGSRQKLKMYSNQGDLIHGFTHEDLFHRDYRFTAFHPTENYLLGATVGGQVFAFMGPSIN